MKVLLVYSYYHHHRMVERLASMMADNGITVKILCTDNCISTVKSPCLWLMRHAGPLGNTRLVHRFFERCLFPALARKFDLVDFHAFISSRIPLMRVCKSKGIRYDITPWGSDILRASPELLTQMADGFEGCRFIKAPANIQAAVSAAYDGRFDSKMRTVFFGQDVFETIDSISPGAVHFFHDRLQIKEGDITVCCGYNAFRPQQHVRILESLGTLPEEIRQRAFILLPMTYPYDPDYVAEVNAAAEKAGLRYKVLDRYMTAEEVAALRLISDVVINMQVSDAFSGSLQGHLYAGGVLVIGEWLEYPMLDDIGAYYIKTNFDALAATVQDVIANLPDYLLRCKDNREKISGLTSWAAVVPAWAETYKI